jgi:Protein-L-isoaspartate(D-aspartate) O-methyltransferase (PCMT)
MCGAILPLCLLQAILLAVGNSQPAVLPDFSAARQRMVQEQLSASGRDIKNRLVLDAMATVPRHEFVPETLRKFAYWDEPLPIGYGQTIYGVILRLRCRAVTPLSRGELRREREVED